MYGVLFTPKTVMYIKGCSKKATKKVKEITFCKRYL